MDICASSATDLLAAMNAREISAVEVMQASLDRIARDNGALNAVVALADP
ncbi:MAG: amidase, partial [Rhodobacteraceae bacterium]|nr:amidase [Paracoccaceae bacterium]